MIKSRRDFLHSLGIGIAKKDLRPWSKKSLCP